MEQTLRKEGGETISWEKKEGNQLQEKKEGKQTLRRGGMETIFWKRRDGINLL